jgi:hypothetical protein
VLVAATVDELLTPSMVTRMPELFGVAQDNLVIDEGLSLSTVMGAGWDAVDGVEMRFFSLPATVGWAGAASVVYADEAAAASVRAEIADFLAGEPDAPASDSASVVAPTTNSVTGATSTTVRTSPPSTGPTPATAPAVDRTGGIRPCS